MVYIKFTDHALDDLNQIAAYIKADAPKAAATFVESVFQKVQHLRRSPKLGRKVPEFNKEDIRELLYGRYRIVYQIISEHEMHILAVYHGAQLLSSESIFR